MKNLIGPEIARGHKTIIYLWGDKHILKLYKTSTPRELVEKSAECCRMVYKAGIRTPAVEDVIEIDGKHGIIFEKIVGPSFLEVSISKPWKITYFARKFAEAHFQINSHIMPELDSAGQLLIDTFNKENLFKPEWQQIALDILASYPHDENNLGHKDFHPGQIIVSGNELVIIDWGSAIRGSMLADVAITSNLIRAADIPFASFRTQSLFRLVRKNFIKEYQDHYLKISDKDRNDLNKWELVLAFIQHMRLSSLKQKKGARILEKWINRKLNSVKN